MIDEANAMKLTFVPNGISLEQIAYITGGRIPVQSNNHVRGISIDSRTLVSGDLFVAIRGDRFDGHSFIAKALENGAAGIIAEEIPNGVCGDRIILVDDTLQALGKLASSYKEGINPITIAVTGSVGKTTTKQFLASVIGAAMPTHSTAGNYNNEIGLPLTLLSLRDEHRASVLEMAMSAKGEIEYLSKMAKPDIGVITCIGTSHIENLGSREAIRDAKLEIVKGLKKDGKLILNGDEPLLSGIDGAVYVGEKNDSCDYLITNIRQNGAFTLYDLRCPSKMLKDLKINVPGKHNVFDSALAVATADIINVNEHAIRLGLEAFQNTGMRQRFEDYGNVTFIADCYNAAPESMKASLQVLKSAAQERGGRSVAVLGEMRELGEYSSQLHRCVGTEVANTGVDVLFTFGEEANLYAVGAFEAGMNESCIISYPDLESPEKLAEGIKNCLRDGDTVLFKASRAVAMERVIDLLKKEK